MAKSVTTKQSRFMAICANGKGGKNCPPVAVAKRFVAADSKNGMLSRATKEINRTKKNNRFAKGLRSS